MVTGTKAKARPYLRHMSKVKRAAKIKLSDSGVTLGQALSILLKPAPAKPKKKASKKQKR